MSTTEDMSVIKRELYAAIERDPLGVDCSLVLFECGLNSYRHDTVLRPFPPDFILVNGEKDIEGLRSLFKLIPSIKEIKNTINSINEKQLRLIHWIVYNKTFTLSFKPGNKFSIIKDQTPVSVHYNNPYCFYELIYSHDKEIQWKERVGSYGTFLAYHGSKMENFHSITHTGLLSHMNKVGIFGEGTYLSTDLSVCMNFSPCANTWCYSTLPPLCSMVAVCQVINHPDIKSRVQHGGEPSLNQKIPERYFVVTNDELIRIKYIVVFAQERTRTVSRYNNSLQWCSNHKWLLMVIFYLILLLFLGLWQSKFVTKLYYQYSRRYLSL